MLVTPSDERFHEINRSYTIQGRSRGRQQNKVLGLGNPGLIPFIPVVGGPAWCEVSVFQPQSL